MTFYRRRLPHVYETERSVCLTWRLHDSLPPHRAFPTGSLNSGQAFAAIDRLPDEARSVPFYLRQPDILGHYVLHAFVVMPNHVHLRATPAIALQRPTKSLKGITAKRANAMLALTGSPFWREQSYDHLVRHRQEFDRVRNCIEGNPVRAGWASEANDYRWSSAGWAMTQRVPRVARAQGARPGVRPTTGQLPK